MRYIVLDTNCLLQSLPSRSPYHKIWTDIMAGEISLCVNTDIPDEYEEKLAEIRKKPSKTFPQNKTVPLSASSDRGTFFIKRMF